MTDARNYQNPMDTGDPQFHPALGSLNDIFADMNYPQSRDAVLKYARHKNADRALLNKIEELPDITFHNMDNLAVALGVGRHVPEEMHLNPEDQATS
jgi:hypothetical protein